MFTYTDGLGNIEVGHYDIIPDQTAIISGQTYVDFYSGGGGINGVRQDGNQLIWYDPISLSDVLVMDWDSNVRDTIFNLFSEGTNYNAVVTNKDSVVLIGGGYHHFINLVGYEYLDNVNWIAENWDITWNERGLCGENHQGWNPGGGIAFNMPESWF